VEQEQDANFISRLHGGKLDIIPWPVIESKGFYKSFATIKRRLDLQKVSHRTAGEFLHRIKTLMAKLKARLSLCCQQYCSERLPADQRLGNAFSSVSSSSIFFPLNLFYQQRPWLSIVPSHSLLFYRSHLRRGSWKPNLNLSP
jgi:hypothetical protein